MESVTYNCSTQLKNGTIIRLQTLPSRDKEDISLMSVSMKGRIGIYDLALNLRTSFLLHFNHRAESTTKSSKGPPKKNKTQGWITDAVCMEDCNILVVASCERSLHFFTMAAVPFTERFRMYGMKDIATCLAYMPARMGFSDSVPSLVIGDDGGDVFVLNFLKHSQALFKKTEVDEVEQIYWRELHLQAGMVKFTVLPGCHNSPVLQVDIKGTNVQRVISCSRSSRNSLAIRHVRGKMAPIFYHCVNGVTCFDFDEKNGLVVTGSADAKIRLWSLTEKAKAWLTLSGHTVTIVSVWLHNDGNDLWSLCEKPELRTWDLTQVACIRRIDLNFTSDLNSKKNARMELGQNPLVFIKSKGVLYITCGDQIATMNLGCEETDSSFKPKRNSMTPVVDSMSNVEQKIPSHFREGLLDYGNYEEDEHFYKFVEDLKCAFQESTKARHHLEEFEESAAVAYEVKPSESQHQDILDFHPSPSNKEDKLKSVYDWEEKETAIVMTPNNLIPMNEIKLREMGRMAEIEKHVKAGTPFCSLQLLVPLEVQLPAGLPVTTRMKKRGIQTIENLDQVRAMTVDLFTDGILSSLSSARSSLASSVLSYYKQKKTSEKSPSPERSVRSNLHVSASGSKSSLDILSPRSDHSTKLDELLPP